MHYGEYSTVVERFKPAPTGLIPQDEFNYKMENLCVLVTLNGHFSSRGFATYDIVEHL